MSATATAARAVTVALPSIAGLDLGAGSDGSDDAAPPHVLLKGWAGAGGATRRAVDDAVHRLGGRGGGALACVCSHGAPGAPVIVKLTRLPDTGAGALAASASAQTPLPTGRAARAATRGSAAPTIGDPTPGKRARAKAATQAATTPVAAPMVVDLTLDSDEDTAAAVAASLAQPPPPPPALPAPPALMDVDVDADIGVEVEVEVEALGAAAAAPMVAGGSGSGGGGGGGDDDVELVLTNTAHGADAKAAAAVAPPSAASVLSDLLPLNTVVEVPPFKFGHVTARHAAATGGGGGGGGGGGAGARYTVDLWCGAQAHVVASTPGWGAHAVSVAYRPLARYPTWGARGSVALAPRDAYTLTPKVWLNDSVVEFYTKYLHAERLLPHQRALAHVFGPYFFTQLGSKLRDITAGTLAPRVLGDVDPFAHNFLFIPVNDKLHWSTVVVCYPGLLLPGEDGRGRVPPPMAPGLAAAAAGAAPDARAPSSAAALSRTPSAEGGTGAYTGAPEPSARKRGRAKGEEEAAAAAAAAPTPTAVALAPPSLVGDIEAPDTGDAVMAAVVDGAGGGNGGAGADVVATSVTAALADLVSAVDAAGTAPPPAKRPRGDGKKKRGTPATPGSSAAAATPAPSADADAPGGVRQPDGKRARRAALPAAAESIDASSSAPEARRRERSRRNASGAAAHDAPVVVLSEDGDGGKGSGAAVDAAAHTHTPAYIASALLAGADVATGCLVALYAALGPAAAAVMPPAVPLAAGLFHGSGGGGDGSGSGSGAAPAFSLLPDTAGSAYVVQTVTDVLMADVEAAAADAAPAGGATATEEEEADEDGVSASATPTPVLALSATGGKAAKLAHLRVDGMAGELGHGKRCAAAIAQLQAAAAGAAGVARATRSAESATLARLAAAALERDADATATSGTAAASAAHAPPDDGAGAGAGAGGGGSGGGGAVGGSEPFRRKREARQHGAFASAMSAARVRATVLVSPELRAARAASRNAAVEDAAAAARLAHAHQLRANAAHRAARSAGAHPLLPPIVDTAEQGARAALDLCTAAIAAYTEAAAGEAAGVMNDGGDSGGGSGNGGGGDSGGGGSGSGSGSGAADTSAPWAIVEACHALATHWEAVSAIARGVLAEAKSRAAAHAAAVRTARGEHAACVMQYKAAVARVAAMDGELAGEVAAASAPPAPCILLLDSLKMHRGQEIARRVRLYLEAEFRARYMSPEEVATARTLAAAQKAAAAAARGSSGGAGSAAAAATSAAAAACGSSGGAASAAAAAAMAAAAAAAPDADGDGDATMRGNDPLSMDFFLSALAAAPKQPSRKRGRTSDAAGTADVHADALHIRAPAALELPAARGPALDAGTPSGGGSGASPGGVVAPHVPVPVPVPAPAATGPSWLSALPALFEAAKCPCKQPEHLPRQDNDYDCGVFALQYVESFCTPLLPHVTAAHLASVARMRALFGDFFGVHEVEGKRAHIRAIMLNDVAARPACLPPPQPPQALPEASAPR